MTATRQPTPVPPPFPSRDDDGTTRCPVCRRVFTPTGRQTYCTSACRKTAYRRRHQQPVAAVAVPAARPRRDYTVYECPTCEQRLIGAQRCPDCATFARRVSIGGPCPHCDQPVALTDLLDAQMIQVLTNRVPVDNRGDITTLHSTHRRQPSA